MKRSARITAYNFVSNALRIKNKLLGKNKIKCESESAFIFVFPGVQQYLNTLGVVANSLVAKNVNVTFFTCDSIISECVSTSQPGSDKDYTCSRCQFDSCRTLDRFGFQNLSMNTFCSNSIVENVSEIVDSCKDLEKLRYKNTNIPQLALIDLSLNKKQRTLNVHGDDDRFTREYVKSILIIYEAALSLFEKYKPNVVCFNSDYTHNMAIAKAASKFDIRVINVGAVSHRIADRRRSFIFEGLWEQALFKNYEAWASWRNIPLSKDEVFESYEDIFLRLNPGSKRVYSPPFRSEISYRKIYNVKNRKLVVAYTSSEDEAISTKKELEVFGVDAPFFEQPFLTQIEWLNDIVEYADNNPDLFLIIRVHPREGQNRFENKVSDHLISLKKKFENLPENVKFVWPENKISSYSLASEADLVLISWSNIGMEFARMGVPILASMVRISSVPHDKFIVRRKNREEYYSALRELLEAEVDVERILLAHRWYILSKFRCSVEFNDIYPKIDSDVPSSYTEPSMSSELVYRSVIKGENLLKVYLEDKVKVDPDDYKKEKEVHKKYINYLISFVRNGTIEIMDKDLMEKEDDKLLVKRLFSIIKKMEEDHLS